MKKTKIATLRLMCIVLFALISYVVPTYAQEQALIAHILTDTQTATGCLAQLEVGSSSKYTQLTEIIGDKGFFWDEQYYIAFHYKSDDSNTKQQDIEYSICNISNWEVSTYTTAYNNEMAILSATYIPTEKIVNTIYKDGETGQCYIGAMVLDNNELLPASEEPIELLREIYALCASPEGKVYGFASDAYLYHIDMHTGTYEKLFSSSAVGKEQQAAWYDSATNEIYRAVPSSIGTTLYSYNLENKTEKFVKIYPSITTIVALNIITQQQHSAPLPISNLSIQEDYVSGLINISFTAPLSDTNGILLSDSVFHCISIDNINVDTIISLPGEECSASYTLDNGLHKISIVTENSYGKSKTIEKDIFVGFDIPSEVTNIDLIFSPPYVRLSWSQPHGIHGNKLDIDNMRYRIVRYPDEIVIADTTASITSICDSLPSQPREYYYGITAYLPNYTTIESLSKRIYHDCIIELPYELTTWERSILKSFDIKDNNNDGATWHYFEAPNTTTTMRYCYSPTQSADDYIYLPQMNLKKGLYHEATIHLHAGSEMYDEHFAIGITRNSDEQHTTLLSQTIRQKTSTAYKVGFTVDTDDVYRLYVQCTSPANHHILHLDSISVVACSDSHIPGSIEEFTIDIDDRKPHIVTLQCTAPSVYADGTPLDELDELIIYRNEQPIHHIHHPSPTSTITYNDTVDVLDNYTYRVLATNSNGIGIETSQTIRAGAATFPFAHSFDNGIGYFTTIDNNNDATSWHYYDGRFMGCMRYMSNRDNAADDWLISPPIYLSDSIRYQIEFECCAGHSSYPESMRIVMGRSPHPNDMSVLLKSLDNFTIITDTTIIAPIDIYASGIYYIAFQATSQADSYAILLRNMCINQYNPMSVAQYEADNIRVYGNQGAIVVHTPNPSDVYIYNSQGMLIDKFTTDTPITHRSISAGIYWVRVENYSHAIVVR